ncbi:MAG: HEAT repeat domain-containing protein [Planctomycetota bacterium]
MKNPLAAIACAVTVLSTSVLSTSPLRADVEFLESQFEIPAGFRLYKIAGREHCGASLDITFDGEGRLLVGDGKNVRRLIDTDGDAVIDRSEVIAEGLGPRGPQGLLVYSDRLFAVGADGLQVFEGYRKPTLPGKQVAPPKRGQKLGARKRIGAPFRTGGDHDAHTILRGHDDYIYLVTGDGGGARDRVHTTETSSPALRERTASVFRIDPSGKHWECIATGGRNPPNLGLNARGDFFSLDSDMEWHVDLPWWRPVRLNHWMTGSDQGWQGVGAYPSYYIDCVPGIHDLGRGSPDWGLFYDHDQFPNRYRDSYFVADYRSKSATSGGYETTGKLYAFTLFPKGASYEVEHEVFATPKSGAKDGRGRPIDFALVDVEVGPDGSLYVSDHGQGIWRIIYDPERTSKPAPPILPRETSAARKSPLLAQLLSLPQSMAEWSRLRRERLRAAMGANYLPALQRAAVDPTRSTSQRLKALRLIAADFRELPSDFLIKLAKDSNADVRGYVAWLLGIRGKKNEANLLARTLAQDESAYVRRRALESLARNRIDPKEIALIIARLDDDDRWVRYCAMTTLSHYPLSDWAETVFRAPGVQAKLRGLVASALRREKFSGASLVISQVLADPSSTSSKENQLDFLRVLSLYRDTVERHPALRDRVAKRLLGGYPPADSDIRFETTRLIGEYRLEGGFGKLADQLGKESDGVRQFHIAQAIAKIPSGWTEQDRERAAVWFLTTQSGWFTQLGGKGRQFGQFWATVLNSFANTHAEALAKHGTALKLDSRLGRSVLDALTRREDGLIQLSTLYENSENEGPRVSLLDRIARIRTPDASRFLRAADDDPSAKIKDATLRGLARQEPYRENQTFLEEGLFHEEGDIVRDCALALVKHDVDASEEICSLVLTKMISQNETFRAGERLLARVSGKKRDGYNERANARRNPSDDERTNALKFWKGWYQSEFGTEFEPVGETQVVEKKNDEVYRFLLSDKVQGGQRVRGQKVYATLCARCHGASGQGAKEMVIFGPDLTGVTRRLQPKEIAESIVYPSKVIEDRFRSTSLTTRGGQTISGFVTAKTDKTVTLVSQDRVHKIPKRKILLMAPEESSLMPDGLINRLEWDEIRDLMAYLGEVGAKPEPKKKAKIGPAGPEAKTTK